MGANAMETNYLLQSLKELKEVPKEDSSLGLQCLRMKEESVGLMPKGLWDLLE